MKSAIERAILITDHEQIQVEDLMLDSSQTVSPWSEEPVPEPVTELRLHKPQPIPEEPGTQPRELPVSPEDEPSGEIVSLEQLKHRAVRQAYMVCEGNVDRAAVELGIGRATMYRLLKKYDLMT